MSGHWPLGDYLRDRRRRIDPASLGLPAARRRTPGLRREEVAQRAAISPTWYTWLEQGRGGAPSAMVLDRIAKALLLTQAEREHLFLLGLGRAPEVAYSRPAPVSPRLQRVLDGFDGIPALVKTPFWDVVVWNRAASLVLSDYAALPPAGRNVMRLMFGGDSVVLPEDRVAVARFVVGVFRAETTRAGAIAEREALAAELCASSPAFAALWRENGVAGFGEGTKRILHPVLGPLALDYSTFIVDGQPGLGMVVFNPVAPDAAARIAALVASQPTP